MTNAVAVAQYGGLGATKNRIINGAMMIDQRNAGASITPINAQYSVDRWGCNLTQASKYSVQQSTASPSSVFFKNSLAVTVGASANVTVGAGDVFAIYQFFEGLNTADLGWGTSAAQAVTVSFWAKASVAGTYALQLQNYAQTYSYIGTYTLAANTWQYVTITIPGQTSGVWATDNTTSLMLRFILGSGSTYSTSSPNTWQASNYWTASGCTNIITTNSATFNITGVQLEKGTTATPFEQRLYTTELQLCQRYFYKLVGGGSGYLYPAVGAGHCGSATTAYAVVPLPVTMRSSATALHNGTMSVNSGGVDYSVTSLGILYGYGSSQWITLNVSGGGMTTGRGCITYCGASTNDWFQLSSEL